MREKWSHVLPDGVEMKRITGRWRLWAWWKDKDGKWHVMQRGAFMDDEADDVERGSANT